MKDLRAWWMMRAVSMVRTPVFVLAVGAAVVAAHGQTAANRQSAPFGPNNPFYAPSTLPFHAPPFNRIKDSDYQPAIDAGMAEQRKEVEGIASNPAPPTFENTLVALEKSRRLREAGAGKVALMD